MANLVIKLLGDFAIFDGQGVELSLPTRKARALIAFLAFSAGQWHGRDRLASLLWSDRQEAQARHSLTQALGSIRKLSQAIGTELIESEGERIRLLAPAVEVDVIAFRDEQKSDPSSAVERYAGALLDDFSVPDPAFEDWLKVEREKIREMACDALERAAKRAENQGDHRQAIELARRLVGLDTYREASYRLLMEVLASSGARTEAIRQYQACEKLLAAELGVKPAAETKALLQQIKAGDISLPSTSTSDAEQPAPLSDSPSLPDNPSVAVLPFTNLSGDPEQEYFCDGIAEDLITALSNVRSFFVIDRSSSFSFKGKSADVREIGRRLGIRYVLEGSVRKAKEKARVSAQLVEAETGNHVWADHFDGDLEYVFDLQDSIVASVVGALEPQMLRAELDRIRQKRPENFNAYDLALSGLSHMNKLTPEDTEAAMDLFRKAIDADPGYARAYAMAAWCYRRRVYLRGMVLTEEEKKDCLHLARTALQLDNTDPYVLWQVGATMVHVSRDFDGGRSLVDRSLAANPNSCRALNTRAIISLVSGEPKAAMKTAERAMRLSPLDTWMWFAYGLIADARLQLANYEEAADWARRSVQLQPDFLKAHLIMIASLAQTDRFHESEAALAELLRMEPGLTVTSVLKRFSIGQYQNLDGFLEGLTKAGLPQS